jgi:predicted anti-sigma-YlaC factor YlaD
MLSCEVVTDLMAAYESGEASAETRRLVDEHLAGCAACRSAFGKGARVETVLTRPQSPTGEKPVNGASFVFRTRRLLFFFGVGALLLGAAQAAVVMRVFTRTVTGAMPSPFGPMTGGPLWFFHVSPTLAFLAAAAAAAAYIAVVLSTARRPQGSRDAAITRAVVGGVLLTILALSTLYLWVTGTLGPGLLSFVLLTGALAVTATRLSRLPYFTIAAVVSIFAAILVLLNAVLVGRFIGRF